MALPAPDLFETLFAMLPTGAALLAPVYEADGRLLDFAWQQLNPAAQQLLALPARPAATLLQQLPAGTPADLLAGYRAAFETGKLTHLDLPYRAGSDAGRCQLAAQRSGELLLVHFAAATDATAELLPGQPQAPAPPALGATEHQRLLGQILGEVPAAIVVLDGPDYQFTYFNEQYQLLADHRARLNAPVAEVLPEVVEQGFIAVLDGVRRSGQPFVGTELAILLAQPAGPPRQLYVSLTYQVLPAAPGQLPGILMFAVDVTEQVRARKQADALQAALLATAQRQAQEQQDFYQLFEQAPVTVMLLHGADHRLEYVNPAGARIWQGRQLRGRPLAESMPEAVEQGFVALLDRVYQTGEPHEGLGVSLVLPAAADGQPRTHYFDFTYQVYRQQDQTVGIAVFATDVTAQVLAHQQVEQLNEQLEVRVRERTRALEEAMRVAQQAKARAEHDRNRLQAIFAQAPVGIALFEGAEQVVTLANADICAMWGHAPAQVLHQPLLEAVPELRGQGFEGLLAEVARTGVPFVGTEAAANLRQADGTVATRYFNFVYQPLRGLGNELLGVLDIAIDVTAQVLARRQVEQLNGQLEGRVQERTEYVQTLNEELAVMNEELMATNEELHDSNTRLTHTNTDLDSFVYTASHDLKAPIANIEGLLYALREDLPPELVATPAIAHLLRLMSDSVARFQNTLGHLAHITHQQRPSVAPAAAINLAALVEDVRLDLAPTIEATQTWLLVEVGQCPQLQFSPKDLRSIIFNLISNAIKYRAPSRTPVVRLRVRCTDYEVVLTVKDNGLGLTREQQDKLFGLFRRLHTHVEGSGVGLYSIKRLIENAGGSIAVESAIDVGTTFIVRLPVKRPKG